MRLEEGIFWGVAILLVCFYNEAETYIEHHLDHQKRMDHLEYMETAKDLMSDIELEISRRNSERIWHEADSIFNSY